MPTCSQSKSSTSATTLLPSSLMTPARRDELNSSVKVLYDLLRVSKDVIAKATDPDDVHYKVAVLDFLDRMVRRICPFVYAFHGSCDVARFS